MLNVDKQKLIFNYEKKIMFLVQGVAHLPTVIPCYALERDVHTIKIELHSSWSLTRFWGH